MLGLLLSDAQCMAGHPEVGGGGAGARSHAVMPAFILCKLLWEWGAHGPQPSRNHLQKLLKLLKLDFTP